MGIARSTLYDAPKRAADDTTLVEAMHAIKNESVAYGWRRIQAALGQQGWVVNHKTLKRLTREKGLNARRRRRYVTTIDGDHDQPNFPDSAKDVTVDGPNQLWGRPWLRHWSERPMDDCLTNVALATLTNVALATGFAYVAVVMDVWSRRIFGHAMGRRIDARLTLTALDAAIAPRRRPPGTCTTVTEGCNTPPQSTVVISTRRSLSGRWAGAEIHTTL